MPNTRLFHAKWRLPTLAGPAISIVLLLATALYWHAEGLQAEAKRQAAAERALERITDSLAARVTAHEIVLRGLKGYFEGSEAVTRAEFHSYVSQLRLQHVLPGLQGVAYVLSVRGGEAAEHAARMRAMGLEAYFLRAVPEQGEYRPLVLIEPPTEDNLRVLGVNTAAVAAAREAQDRARDSGAAAITRGLLLRQDVGLRTDLSVVMYLPMYLDGAQPAGGAERRAALIGWVSGPLRMRDFVEGMAPLGSDEVAIAIFDGPADQPASLLYRSPSYTPGAVEASARKLPVGGRTWTVAAQPLPVLAQRYGAGERHLVALLAALLSVSVGWFVWSISTRRDDAVALAERMTQELRQTRDELKATLDATPDWMVELDRQGRVLQCHNAPGSALYEQAAQLLGKSLPEAASAKTALGCRAALDTAANRGYSSGHEFELQIDGECRWIELSVARKHGAGTDSEVRLIALLRDVSERKQAAERTHRLAYFDPLTALPNRRMLFDRLTQALRSATLAGRMGALMFLDLDHFKHINDAHGHSAGDALLVQVAQRLTATVSSGDTVAHMGGDEFVVLARDLAGDSEEAGLLALRLAEELRRTLDAPFSIGGRGFSSSVSIGLTLFPKQGEGVEDLLREADTAMYRAKDLGRNRTCFFEAAMQVDVQRRLALEQDLKVGFATTQLSAFVQPQVDAHGRVVGAELLMRWQHPQRGAISPAEFIPVAEASGLIVQMGDWMVEQACDALVQLHAAGVLVPLSVNVSQRQFRHEGFVKRIQALLARSGARADHLVLEVTESLLAEQMDETIARMGELVALGVRFSIDDFGTGYSSLAYLRRMPLYELKIDRSFVQDTPSDANDTAIVQTILSMARNLGLRVVAEGVETPAQAEFLAANRCDVMQGYLFGRPEPLAGWVARRIVQAG